MGMFLGEIASLLETVFRVPLQGVRPLRNALRRERMASSVDHRAHAHDG
jgi:hypothetical protein